MASLLDELLLLAYDDTTGKCRTSYLNLGLGGAIVLELTLAQRIDVVDKKVVVIDATPTGDALLDERLAAIANDKPRAPRTVVERAGKGVRQRVLDDLVARGVLRHEQSMVLGLFPSHRYLPADAGIEADVRFRLSNAVTVGEAGNARTAAIASLVYALQLTKVAFPGRDQRATRKALKRITEGSWASDATRKAVEAAQAAVMAAMVAATSAAAGSSGGS
ncbi:GOLPH3/VPS74 family protein [Glycomyces buryatensis]|uniref:GPP34 family phosphoprotein n=1 Tax=Glycomyces buryatensis TaxID=2570927 RepID=A0A4S8QG18_9ACTN|nr:GPP34 family phosphoprotein [Glycomyces buryatensis]THV41885.1 GPP34 family phosphoprotein [Glycomyces buryatensis]